MLEFAEEVRVKLTASEWQKIDKGEVKHHSKYQKIIKNKAAA